MKNCPTMYAWLMIICYCTVNGLWNVKCVVSHHLWLLIYFFKCIRFLFTFLWKTWICEITSTIFNCELWMQSNAGLIYYLNWPSCNALWFSLIFLSFMSQRQVNIQVDQWQRWKSVLTFKLFSLFLGEGFILSTWFYFL